MSFGDGHNVLVSSPLNTVHMNESWEAWVFEICLLSVLSMKWLAYLMFWWMLRLGNTIRVISYICMMVDTVALQNCCLLCQSLYRTCSKCWHWCWRCMPRVLSRLRIWLCSHTYCYQCCGHEMATFHHSFDCFRLTSVVVFDRLSRTNWQVFIVVVFLKDYVVSSQIISLTSLPFVLSSRLYFTGLWELRHMHAKIYRILLLYRVVLIFVIFG